VKTPALTICELASVGNAYEDLRIVLAIPVNARIIDMGIRGSPHVPLL